MTGEPKIRIAPRPEDRVGLMQATGDPEEDTFWEHVHPRKIDDQDWRRFEGYVAEIFQALGMDLDTLEAIAERIVRELPKPSTGS